MLQSTPMLSRQDSNDALLCQRATARPVWTRTGMVETEPIIAAVARAYTAAYYLADDVTPAAILGPGRTPTVAWARHLCAYLLAEDYHLTATAAGQALGRRDHTTILNSKARITAALAGHDGTLATALAHARATLAGEEPALRARSEQDRDRAHSFAAATPTELAEYRYWRLRSLRAGSAW